MDEETRSALSLTGEQLRAMRAAGEPGTVAKRPRDLNQVASAIVGDATAASDEETAWLLDLSSFGELHVSIKGLRVEPGFKERDRFLSAGDSSVTIA